MCRSISLTNCVPASFSDPLLWMISPLRGALCSARCRISRASTPLDAPQEFLSEANRERAAQAAAQDSALMRALGLAHHWQRLLDEERAASVAEIAKAEGMDVTQVRRVMRLTLLAPEVIERLVGAPDIVLEQVMRRPWPGSWGEQLQVMSLAA